MIDFQVTFNEEHFEQMFNKDDIVYLTPDSDNVLDTLSKEHVYILGGLVDEHILKVLLYNNITYLW